MPLKIVRENIVHMKTDAIVNTADEDLRPSGGVCGSIFDKAGKEKLTAACNKLGGCKVGCAVVTEGFELPARYVIHTVGPVWQGERAVLLSQLKSCYKSVLSIADGMKLQSVAIPLISSGSRGCPKDIAFSVAVSEISSFLMTHDEPEMTVYIVVYDSTSFLLSQKLFSNIESFIDENYVQSRVELYHLQPRARTTSCCENSFRSASESSLAEVMSGLDAGFSETLLKLIDKSGLTDAEVYKRANIDRKHFSKIRSNKDYKPTKPTVVAFAVALRLNLAQTKDLLMRAGFALSRADKFDVIIEYFITNGEYNVFEINEALFAYDQQLLGC